MTHSWSLDLVIWCTILYWDRLGAYRIAYLTLPNSHDRAVMDTTMIAYKDLDRYNPALDYMTCCDFAKELQDVDNESLLPGLSYDSISLLRMRFFLHIPWW